VPRPPRRAASPPPAQHPRNPTRQRGRRVSANRAPAPAAARPADARPPAPATRTAPAPAGAPARPAPAATPAAAPPPGPPPRPPEGPPRRGRQQGRGGGARRSRRPPRLGAQGAGRGRSAQLPDHPVVSVVQQRRPQVEPDPPGGHLPPVLHRHPEHPQQDDED